MDKLTNEIKIRRIQLQISMLEEERGKFSAGHDAQVEKAIRRREAAIAHLEKGYMSTWEQLEREFGFKYHAYYANKKWWKRR